MASLRQHGHCSIKLKWCGAGQEEAATDEVVRPAANENGNRNGYAECGSQNGCQLVEHVELRRVNFQKGVSLC